MNLKRTNWLPMPTLPKPGEGRCLEVGHYHQLDQYSCGAIAGWNLVCAFHRDVAWEEFYALCAPDEKWGTPTERLKSALKAFGVGLKTASLRRFHSVRKHIDAGWPLLVVIDCPGSKDEHWCVVYGYEDSPAGRFVYITGNAQWSWSLLNKNRKESKMPWHEFAELWSLTEEQEAYVAWGTKRPRR